MAVQRVQIGVTFMTPETVYVASASGGSATTAITVYVPVVNSPITITDRNTGNNPTVYSAATGSSTVASLETDAGGNVDGWVIEGSYTVAAGAVGSFAGASIAWEAVRGDGVENIYAGAVTSTTLASSVTNLLVPTGAVFDHAGTSAPPGYVFCDGSGHQPSDSDWATYSALHGVIGTAFGTYGTGGFLLPNGQGKFTLGAGSGVSGYNNVGQSGGSLGHTHSVPGLSIPGLTIPTLSIPSLTVNDHTHPLGANAGAQLNMGDTSGNNYIAWTVTPGPTYTAQRNFAEISAQFLAGSATGPSIPLIGNTDDATATTIANATGTGLTGTGTTGAASSGAADPAYLVFNKIIKL